MTWAAIITAIIQIFGPMLAEWLKKWLDSWLNKAAAEMTGGPNGVAEVAGEAFAACELLDKAIQMLPRFAFGRRALLRRIRGYVFANGLNCNPTGYDLAELAELAKLAEND